MRSRGSLRRWPISNPQRAAMRAAMQEVERIFAQGVTPAQQAQARAEIEASCEPLQPQLGLKVPR